MQCLSEFKVVGGISAVFLLNCFWTLTGGLERRCALPLWQALASFFFIIFNFFFFLIFKWRAWAAFLLPLCGCVSLSPEDDEGDDDDGDSPNFWVSSKKRLKFYLKADLTEEYWWGICLKMKEYKGIFFGGKKKKIHPQPQKKLPPKPFIFNLLQRSLNVVEIRTERGKYVLATRCEQSSSSIDICIHYLLKCTGFSCQTGWWLEKLF